MRNFIRDTSNGKRGKYSVDIAEFNPHFPRMDMISDLLIVSDAFCAATGIGRKRLSTLMLQRGARLDEIQNGGDLGTRTWARAMQWLSENWPENAEWPANVVRPVREAAE